MNTVKQTIAMIVSGNVNVEVGQRAMVSFTTKPAPSAKFKGTELIKTTVGSFTIGKKYVPKKVDGQNGGSEDRDSWAEWVSYPFILKHSATGKEYLRLMPDTADFATRPQTSFMVNGEHVSREVFAGYLTPSEAKKLLTPDKAFELCNVKIENVNSIQKLLNS